MSAAINPVNPKKLLHSKWTAVQPRDREKHFIVTEIHLDDAGVPQTCLLEAVHSNRESVLDWRALKDGTLWRTGWR